MRRSRKWRVRLSTVSLPIAALIAAPAGGDEPGSTPQVEDHAEILADAHGVDAESWKRSLLSPFRITEGHGLSYRHSFVLGDRAFKVRLHGPIQRRKSLGLGLQVRF